ncbi:hypothetical protein LWM68_32255 [Niabella sp. W65]|nr:hypothetical protein [Niabella sp. W65]MCH7367031.1 hypothetical protein [Niabella sp. W65]ULT42715.1 hypothetical protein KRR40_03785 [Niabella sp. I65]
MGFAAITKLLGIEHYYGKSEFNNDKEYDGIWGIWDEPFFQFFDEKLSQFPQPFSALFFPFPLTIRLKCPNNMKAFLRKDRYPYLSALAIPIWR